MRRLLVTACVVTLAVGVASGASAASLDAHGWWWRAQTGLLGVDVPPPAVPEDGLAVEATPDGPSAIAAVRYALDEGEIEPVLVLRVAEQQGEPAIQACSATAFWRATQAGVWEERPTYDCGSAVDGAPSEDGATWRWELGALLRDRSLDVVLVPAPGAGRVTFEAPDDASLQTQREGAGSPDFEPPPVSEFTDPGAGTAAGTGSSGGYSPPAFTGGGPSSATGPSFAGPGEAPAVAPPADTGTGELPPQAAPPAEAIAGEAGQPVAALPATSGSSTAVGIVLAAMATLVGFGLWREEAPAARRLGRLAGTGVGATAAAGTATAPRADDGPSVGGLGRFARPRTGSPSPLL